MLHHEVEETGSRVWGRGLIVRQRAQSHQAVRKRISAQFRASKVTIRDWDGAMRRSPESTAVAVAVRVAVAVGASGRRLVLLVHVM